jgi:hypothetical protein
MPWWPYRSVPPLLPLRPTNIGFSLATVAHVGAKPDHAEVRIRIGLLIPP